MGVAMPESFTIVVLQVSLLSMIKGTFSIKFYHLSFIAVIILVLSIAKSVRPSYFIMSTNLATTQSSELAIFCKLNKNFKDINFCEFIFTHEMLEIIYPQN